MNNPVRGSLYHLKSEYFFVLSSEEYSITTNQLVAVPIKPMESRYLHQVALPAFEDGTYVADVSEVQTINATNGKIVGKAESKIVAAVQSRLFALLGYDEFQQRVGG